MEITPFAAEDPKQRLRGVLQIEIPDLSSVMKWIACYMALSRVRSLSELRSIGLTSSIRELIDLGADSNFEFRLPILSQRIGSSNATFVCRL